MNLIKLTKQQADAVRGRHGLYSEIQPMPTETKDMFILNTDVLNDPDLKSAKKLLEAGEVKEFTEVKDKEDVYLLESSVKVLETPVKYYTSRAEVQEIEPIIIEPIIKK